MNVLSGFHNILFSRRGAKGYGYEKVPVRRGRARNTFPNHTQTKFRLAPYYPSTCIPVGYRHPISA